MRAEVVTVERVAAETIEFWFLQAEAAFQLANREKARADAAELALAAQIAKLKGDLQESLLKVYNQELEIMRLKGRVNRLVRDRKARRLAA